MPPGVLQGGPRAAPALLRGLPSQGRRQSQAQPCPGVHLLWPLLWGLACWGAVGTRPRCLRGRYAWLRDASWDLRPALRCSRRTRCPQESGAQAQVSGARVQVPGPRAAAWASVLHPPRPPTLASPRLRTRGRAAGWEAPTPRDRDPRGPVLHTLSRAGRTLLCATGVMTAFWAGPLSTSAGGPCSRGPGADTPACRANLAHCLSV